MKRKREGFLLNPFEDYSAQVLLIVGVFGFIGTVFISYFGKILFDGIIQIHPGETSMIAIVGGNLSNVIILVLGLFLLAKILYKKVRFIDILNNSLIARIPMLIAGLLTILLTGIIPMKKIRGGGIEFVESLGQWNMATIALLAIFLILFIIYFFYLLVVGVRHSVNSKKNVHGFLIVGVVFLLDIVALFIYRGVFI